MAKAAGFSLTSVQRIWRAHGLAPHRIRTFKLSNDPKFAAKVRDIVGLYVDPPAHAVVLSVDEKSQIQALDRTQPGLPLKKGRAGTMTHDYKRNGTTTLFAAFDVLEGKVIGRCMQRHRHQEFIRFLNAVEREVPAGKTVHAILDNYATHKHPKVIEWLGRHPRWSFHFTPTSASWLNAVEGLFAISPSGASSAASSKASSISRPPSIASSPTTTSSQSPSSGPPIQTKSSPPPIVGIKCWIQSTR
jgi:DDE superfamily endonuclease